MLRTETSPAQIHKMESQRPPIYMVSIGRVYRRDTIDATHYPIFHQFEGLAIDEGITLADLKGTLLYVMRELYGPDRELRFRTHYFPFTEPSMEPDVSCPECGGEGCRRIRTYSSFVGARRGGPGLRCAQCSGRDFGGLKNHEGVGRWVWPKKPRRDLWSLVSNSPGSRRPGLPSRRRRRPPRP